MPAQQNQLRNGNLIQMSYSGSGTAIIHRTGGIDSIYAGLMCSLRKMYTFTSKKSVEAVFSKRGCNTAHVKERKAEAGRRYPLMCSVCKHVSNLQVDRLSSRAPDKAQYTLDETSVSRRTHLTLAIITSVVPQTSFPASTS